MKFLISILLMALLSFAVSLYLPWWAVAPACFVTAAFMGTGPVNGFLSGFLALFLLWAGMAWYMSAANEHLLASRMVPVILKRNEPMLLLLVTGLAGGLTGGLSALAGSLFRKTFSI